MSKLDVGSRRHVAGVVTAAGSGQRLGYDIPKALVELVPGQADTALVVMAVNRIAQVTGMQRVVVTAPETHVRQVKQLLCQHGPHHVTVDVVSGSTTRQASVAAGLAALAAHHPPGDAGTERVVLVHDAARPLTPTRVMDELVTTVLTGHVGVIPVLPVTDSLVSVTTDATHEFAQVTGVVPRSSMRRVQTPQAFLWNVLVDAHERASTYAHDELHSYTDDSSVVAAAGHAIAAIDGSEHAVKITTPHDLSYARHLHTVENSR